MARGLGELLVSLGLNTAEFSRGLTKAERDAQQFATRVRSAVLEVGKILGTLEIGRELFSATKDIIAEASALSDLAQATGSTVESLSRLTNQAKIAGSDLATVETALLKLSKGMAGTDAESTKTKEALKLLGVTTRDPVQALEEASVALDKFKNGVNKVGLAAALFGGKDGQVFLKVMQDIANQQEVVSTTTTKQAEEAKRLTTEWNRLSVEATTFKNIVLGLVSPLADVIAQLIEAQRATGGFFSALKLFSDTKFAFMDTTGHLRDLNQELANLEATKKQGGLGETINKAIGLGVDKDIELVKQKIRVAEFILRQEQEAQRSFRETPGATDKPEAPFIPNAELLKKAMQGQLKEQESIIQSEKDLLTDREKFLQIYYQSDQIRLLQFYAGRNAAQEEAFSKQSAALDREVAILQGFIKKTPKPEDRADAENQLAEVIRRRARLEQDNASKGTQGIIEETVAVKQFQDSVEKAAIALAEMRGDTVTAARATFELANKKLIDQANELKNSNVPQQRRLGEIGANTLADTEKLITLRAQLDKATKDYSLTIDELGIAQARIGIDEDLHIITATQANEKRAASIFAVIGALKQEADAMEAVAAATGKREDFVAAAQKRLEIERLTADAILAQGKALQEVQNMLSDALVNPLADFVTGVKSAKDAFKSFTDDIVRQISRIAAQNIANAIFGGKNTAGPDLFGVLAKWLGGLGGTSAGTGIANIGAGGGGGLAFAADGGMSRGGWTVVGERGKELLNLPAGTRITPNHQINRGGSGVSVVQTINVAAGADSATLRQSAKRAFALAARQMQRG